MKKMMKTLTPAFLIAAVAMPAMAQDSVSNIPAPQPQAASDALSPYAAGDNCNQFVVDLVPFTSTWGTAYAGAPLIKSNKVGTQFSNMLISGNGISRGYADVDLAGAFQLWNAPGFGINDQFNNAPNTISVDATTKQFGVAFSEFSGSVNSIVSGVVNFDPANPGRMYVSRTHIAVNGLSESGNTAQFGVGTVDEQGVVAFRADDFNTGSGSISGNNLLTVRSLDRDCGIVNQILNSPAPGTINPADAGATTVNIANSNETLLVPNILPSKFNGTAVPLTTSFDSDYINGSFPATPFANSVTRGSLAFTSRPVLGNAMNGAASVGIYSKPDGDNTRGFQLADIDANGVVVGSWQEYNADTAAVLAQWGGFQNELTTDWEFGHYRGPTAFRGGVSQLAIGSDNAGNTLASAFVSAIGVDGVAPVGAIVAMRDADGIANANEEWTLVVRNSFPGGRANPILDGPGGNIVGYVSNVFDYNVFPQVGPSLSAPAIDALGNIWFTAPVEFVDDAAQPFDPANIEMAVVRAVYNPTSFTYELEAVLNTGEIFAGANSGTNYLINIIPLPANTAIASGAFFSSAVMDSTYADVDRSTLEPASNLSTGGVALVLSVIYDTDGDNFFDFNASDPGVNDEVYQVMYFITPDADPIIIDPPCPCVGDLNGDCVVDTTDLGALLGGFGCTGTGCIGDLNGDGVVDTTDLGALLGDFGCTE